MKQNTPSFQHPAFVLPAFPQHDDPLGEQAPGIIIVGGIVKLKKAAVKTSGMA